MSKEKQIEEMARTMCIAGEICTTYSCIKMNCTKARYAEKLYNAGYRKAAEVAREIFEEIESEIKNHGICYAQRKIAELKKKYTESEDTE